METCFGDPQTYPSAHTNTTAVEKEAAKEYKWNLNNGGIALMWRGGCIIRSVFLGKIKTDEIVQRLSIIGIPF